MLHHHLSLGALLVPHRFKACISEDLVADQTSKKEFVWSLLGLWE